jgi:hypothetical protein
MPYKITSITTKPNLSVPDFDVWLSTVPQSAIAGFPDAAGKTPVQVIQDSVAELDDPAQGFISQGSVPDEDDLVWTWEAIWESQADWANASAKTSYVDGNVAQGQLAGGYLRSLYITENNITVETFYSNI